MTGPWKCFHCGEVFYDYTLAEAHFGKQPVDLPACRIDAAELRRLQDELRGYRNEDTKLQMEIANLKCARRREVQEAEDNGYSKALRDIRTQRWTGIRGIEDVPIKHDVSTETGREPFDPRPGENVEIPGLRLK